MIYKTLRIHVDTLLSLTRYRDHLQVTVNRNRAAYPQFGPSFRVTLDGALMLLIHQQHTHSKRASARRIKGERAKDTYCDEERERMADQSGSGDECRDD